VPKFLSLSGGEMPKMQKKNTKPENFRTNLDQNGDINAKTSGNKREKALFQKILKSAENKYKKAGESGALPPPWTIITIFLTQKKPFEARNIQARTKSLAPVFCHKIPVSSERLRERIYKSLVGDDKQCPQAEVLLVVQNSELVARYQTTVEAEAQARGIFLQRPDIASHDDGHKMHHWPQFGVHTEAQNRWICVDDPHTVQPDTVEEIERVADPDFTAVEHRGHTSF